MHRVFGLLMLLLLALVGSPRTVANADGNWLGMMPGTWNQRGGTVPGAPYQGKNVASCTDVIREAQTPQETLVQDAGWKLFGPSQTLGDVVLFEGAADFDGQCRPLGSNAFAFVGGTFSGTLSPVPMDARSDGDLVSMALYPNGGIHAEFARYKPDDALCCASGKTGVDYTIDRDGSPVLVAQTSSDLAVDSTQIPVETSGAAGGAPTVALSFSSDKIEPNQRFTIRVSANGTNLDSVSWWATDTADEDLDGARVRTCEDPNDCREEWKIKTYDAGSVTFHATARDTQGRVSDEVTRDIKIRANDGRPTIVVNLSDAEDEHFNVNLVGKGDDDGIDTIRWMLYQEGNLTDTEGSRDCNGEDRCEHDWREKTPSRGRLAVHAVATDRSGRQSDEVVKELRAGGKNKNEKPTVDLLLSDDDIGSGDRLQITVRAHDDHGVASIVWWATDTDDPALAADSQQDCDSNDQDCEKTWRVRPDDTGKVTIHAQALDSDGRESEEVVKTLRIRR